MNVNEFWTGIDAIRVASPELSRQIALIKGWLYEVSESDLVNFDEILHGQVLPQAHTYALVFALGAVSVLPEWDGTTEDKLLTWLLLQGREIFERVVKNPDELAELSVVRSEMSLGELLDQVMLTRLNRKSLACEERLVRPDEPQEQEELEKFIFEELPIRYPRLFNNCSSMMEMQWHPSDRQLMHALLERGCVLGTERKIDHSFIVNDRKHAERIVQELETLGHFGLAINKSGDQFYIESSEFLSPLSITRKTPLHLEVAASHNAVYDGWGTSV